MTRQYAPLTDRNGLDADRRFALIRAAFLTALGAAGSSRVELYKEPKPGSNTSEEALVRQYAGELEISVGDIAEAIENAFYAAKKLGHAVTSFRYVLQHIRIVVEAKAARKS